MMTSIQFLRLPIHVRFRGLGILLILTGLFCVSEPAKLFAQTKAAGDSTRSARVDPWHAADKYSHFTVSAMLTAGQFFVLHDRMEVSENRALTAAVASTVVIGIAKEVYDGVSGKGTPSLKDLVADVAGVALVAVLIRAK